MNIRRILHYYLPPIKKHWVVFVSIFVLYGGGVILSDILRPFIYKNLIDTITLHTASPENAAHRLFFLIAILGGMIALYNVFYRVSDFLMTDFQSKALKETADMTFQKIHRHSYGFFTNNFAGAIVAKAKRFVRAFENLHDETVYSLFFNALRIGGIFIALLLIAPLLIALIFLVWCFLYVGVTTFFIRRKISRDLALANADSAVTASFADTITNAITVKMFSAFWNEMKKFMGITEDEMRKRNAAWYFQNWMFLAQATLIGLLEFFSMFVAVKLWISGTITAGTVVLVQVYVASIFGYLWHLGQSFTKIVQSFTDAQEMVDIFEKELDVADPRKPEICRMTKGHIIFDAISFSYEGGTPIFENFSLDIAHGAKVGIVGRSGVGKSTITKLLLRFADVQSGAITIDGQNIRAVAQDDLRSRIAYVPQDPIMFHRTLRENILYGNPTATTQQVVDAARKAHAHEFITNLPHGYDTLVGERGIKLSGGERQRIAIARAILKNAPVLILDEATSSLDSESEQHIKEALDVLMRERTTIVIAHRLSTIQKMDRIVVFENGTIAESGTHAQLLARKGPYYAFWQHQTNGFIE